MSNLTINIPPQLLQTAGELVINLGTGVNVNGKMAGTVYTEGIQKRPYVRRAKPVAAARMGRTAKRNALPTTQE